MSLIARGHVRDRPFARTVYAVAAKRVHGDLLLRHRGQSYRVTWQDGVVVAAVSPSPADSVGRVALKVGLINSTQLSEVLRQLANTPGVPHLDAIALAAKLDESRTLALARRALAERAMRIFALPDADFELSDEPTLTAAPGVTPIPARTLIYRGLVSHYSEERLQEELVAVANARFQLAGTDEAARARLAEYGLNSGGQVCVRYLARQPATLAELRQGLPRIAFKDILSAVYALLSADDLALTQGGRTLTRALSQPGIVVPPATQAPPQPGIVVPPATQAPPQPVIVVPPATQAPPARRPVTSPPEAAVVARSNTPRVPSPAPTQPTPPRFAEGSRSVEVAVSKLRKNAVDPERVAETRALIAAKSALLDADCDHYKLLGVAAAADPGAIRAAYFALAKKLHPDRVRGLGITEDTRTVQHLFASINGAFATLSVADKRARYDASLARGGTGDAAKDQLTAERLANRLLSAEEHFLRGEQAMRHHRFDTAVLEFHDAVAKNPDIADHHASLAWAIWCQAEDKTAVRVRVEQGLKRALALSGKCAAAYFYLGSVAVARENDERALQYFREVLQLQPSHREAELQVRLLESRRAKRKKESKLSSRFKRR